MRGIVAGWVGAVLLVCAATTGRAQTVGRAVAGTQVWLETPPGFQPATGFTGLRRGDAILQVVELKGGNYFRQVSGFTKARFEAKGGTVLQQQDITGRPYAARLVRVRLSPVQESSQLLFGDSTYAVLLDARYPAADTALGTALRRSLLSATYQQAVPAGLSAAPFVLDEKKSPFALAETDRNRLVYSVGGQRKASYGTEPLVTIISFPINASLTAADISRQALQQQAGLSGYTPRKQTSGRINDLITYETEGFAQLNGKRVLVYQQVSVVGSTAVAMLGIAQQEMEQALGQFKSLTHTITARKR
ncbi:hypothetical protein [Hymenobacter pini]|uniref:hypothetical protein n=1 Tax=Hymenobacter pini TaxID=2880879 RepID=UPI001CF1BC7E|nr:hypothetical protein [Hymenobacter pini]MCA8830902.1 hypothetical protein [Hymenobacter pini]